MNKQLDSPHSTTINGSRSCYKTTKRFGFLSVGTILARTINISKKHLEFIFDSLGKRKPLEQTTRKRNLFDLQKKYCAPGTRTRIADVDNRFSREIEKASCAAKINPNTLFLDNTRHQGKE